ncbi:MAG: DMT family transporter [Thiolinea sp.]
MSSSSLQGYLLAILGVFLLSPDSLLIRFIGDDAWLISVWRGLLGGLMILLYNRWLVDRRPIREQLAPARYWLLGMIALTATSQLGFVYAITHANVTDVLVILAFAPLMSAFMSALFLHEKVDLRTWIATLVCALGLAVLFLQNDSNSQVIGLLAAIICAVTMAGQFVIMRGCPEANFTACVGVGNIVGGLVSILLAGSIWPEDSQWLPLLIMCLVVLPVPYMLFIVSLRTITAAETSLIMLLESILGSLWVWAVFAEEPTLQTVMAGLLIVGTLTIYGVLVMRDPGIKEST